MMVSTSAFLCPPPRHAPCPVPNSKACPSSKVTDRIESWWCFKCTSGSRGVGGERARRRAPSSQPRVADERRGKKPLALPLARRARPRPTALGPLNHSLLSRGGGQGGRSAKEEERGSLSQGCGKKRGEWRKGRKGKGGWAKHIKKRRRSLARSSPPALAPRPLWREGGVREGGKGRGRGERHRGEREREGPPGPRNKKKEGEGDREGGGPPIILRFHSLLGKAKAGAG